MATTATRSEGGKAPGPAGAWGVLEAFEATGDEAFAPEANGVTITAQLGSDLLVAGAVRLRGAQDDAAAESQSLGGGAGTGKGFELGAKLVLHLDDRAEGARHGR